MLKDDIANMLNLDYTQCVEFLRQKYGSCLYDYFRTESCKTLNDKADRSKEGLFIHHIDSNIYNGLSSKQVALSHPFSAQKADRLVYCNYLEMLLLHIKIFEDWLAEKCPQIGLGAVLIIIPELNKFYRTGYFAKAKQQIYADVIKDGAEEYKLVLQHLSNLATNGKVDESILQEINKYAKIATKTISSPIALASNASASDPELINKIKNHELGNKNEAFDLYNSLCDFLKEKYGPIDQDYDENPTKRGKEWLDIHHIKEYELDDIAKRTDQAKGKLWFPLFSTMCTLEELKPYNVKEQLVYANKIEHFLLHYLIDSIRGKNVFSGGPNYLWDECIALDYYGFEKEYMNVIKNNKDVYYSLMSSEDITLLYKKLIEWKNWDINHCARYWNTINYMIRYLDEKKVSYVEDKDKFFSLLNIIGYELNEETKNKIATLPFKYLTIEWNGQKTKIYKKHLFSLDEKTAIIFNVDNFDKSFSVPSCVERIATGAFRCGRYLETITIPTTVQEIESNVFVVESKGIYFGNIWSQIGPLTPVLVTESMRVGLVSRWDGKCLPNLKTIIYKGTRQQWNEKFSNVDLDGIALVCKK